ncbi:DUF3089 domain-containing protein [Phenylobacterium deserti]|uniref:DUF3089 domain-containing protein n=1 Tax=Phenylobacterium deserti TaxID=1914756 RepID=A0A328ABT7_9CAUL|nr:DUF3089 domain-containing protein [Phenylobacterium deserti]RAK52069.1 DUF3089 domain-containing protein [Phenylobacterium deserti]
MAKVAPRSRRWLAVAAIGVLLLLGVGTGLYWGDLVRNALDPKEPFQTYEPPPAPDYDARAGWALLPTEPATITEATPRADVFFIAPTMYDGGDEWNAPAGDPKTERLFREVMAPNYAGPFVRVGRIFTPRYRQASLYSLLTLREDAREARKFAYGDVQRSFREYVGRYNMGRPFILVGVEQGGTLGARLLEEIAADPQLRSRLVAAYLIETVTPADSLPLPPCVRKGQAGCVAAWASVFDGQIEGASALLNRALVWSPAGDLVNLNGRSALCFNPILGAVTDAPAPARLHMGAANATGLEWDARPAFMARQVSARCQRGLLHVTAPKSASLKRTGGWADRRKVPGYNLFYADLEADARARLASLATPAP